MHIAAEPIAGLGQVYDAHSGFVRSCLRRFRIREDNLDDAVQDVFVTMLGRAGRSYDQARHVRPWLFGISRNVAMNQRRRAARRSRLDAAVKSPASEAASPEDAVARAEASELLAQFLERLDPERLAPFIGVDIEGRTAADVAAELGLPITTVRWRVRSARAELETLASRRSARRLPGLIVWLWPWQSTRLAPRLLWLAFIFALVTTWMIAARPGSGDRGGASNAAPGSVADGGRLDIPTPRPAARTTPPSIELQTASILGRVLDAEAKPIAGARVCHRVDVFSRREIDDVEAACSTSEADGRYRLAGVSAGTHRVSASAPGFLPSDHGGDGVGRVRVKPAQRYGDVDIVLHRGGVKIAGTVKDRTGGVVPGAIVRAKDFTRFSESWAAIDVADEEGRFSLWVAPGAVAVTANAKGYSAAQASATAPQDGVVVSLMPEVRLAGTVVDADGAPVAGVLVRANRDQHNAPEQHLFATSDARGRFVLTRLRPGSYRPTAAAAHWYGEATDPVLLAFGGDSPDVEIVVGPAATLRIDIETDPALGGCEGDFVMASGDDVRYDARVVESRATLLGVRPGHYELFSRCSGSDARLDVDVGDQPEVRATLRFDAVSTVRGRLERRGGLGPFTAVLVVPAGSKFEGPMLPDGYVSTKTDADGAFVAALSGGGDYDIAVTTVSGSNLPLRTFTVGDDEHADLGDLELPALGTIEGRVVDSEGHGVAGLSVRPLRTSGLGASTRPDGSFTIVHVVPGDYEFQARQRFLKLGEPVAVTVEGSAAATITLAIASMNGAQAGTVRTAQGEPVPDATVKLDSLDPTLTERFRTLVVTQSDLDGRFDQSGLRPGEYDVSVKAESVPREDGTPCEGVARVTVPKKGHGPDVVVVCD